MSDMRIIYTDPNTGGCSVVIPAKKESIEKSKGKMTDEEYLNHVINRSVPKGTEHRVTHVSNVPEDRTFRGAWTDEFNTDTVDVDIVKARDIKHHQLRHIRDSKLQELDIETFKGNDVEAEKQALRDLPDTLDLESITDIDELRDHMPAILL